MKWASYLTLILVTGLFTTLGSPIKAAETNWQTKWEQTLQAAKKEGKVVMYAIVAPRARAAAVTGFRSKYGLELEFVAGHPAEIAQRFLSEQNLGRNHTDVLNAGGGTLLNVIKPRGLLESIEPLLILPEVRDPGAWMGNQLPFVDKDGTVVALISSYETYILRNHQLVSDNAISTFGDLLDPQWKGKMVMSDPTVTGAGISFVAFLVRRWGEEKAVKFFADLVKQNVVFTRDTRQQVEWVARGKYAVAIGAFPDQIVAFAAVGAPIVPVTAKEGGMVQNIGAAISMPKNAPNPNARMIFVNWLLTKEGMTIFSNALGHPSRRKDVSTEGINPIFIPKAGDAVLPETEEHYLIIGKMLPVVKKILTSLQK